MHFQLTDELPKLLQELGTYADAKLAVDTWHDHTNAQLMRVTLHTSPPAVVCLLRWDGPRWRVDAYRPGGWERWLKATLLELRRERERERLARQVRDEQAAAKSFTPIDDSELFG